MKLEIGKRYKFTSTYSGNVPVGKRYMDGLLEKIENGWAYVVCRNGDRWRINPKHLLPFKKI